MEKKKLRTLRVNHVKNAHKRYTKHPVQVILWLTVGVSKNYTIFLFDPKTLNQEWYEVPALDTMLPSLCKNPTSPLSEISARSSWTHLSIPHLGLCCWLVGCRAVWTQHQRGSWTRWQQGLQPCWLQMWSAHCQVWKSVRGKNIVYENSVTSILYGWALLANAVAVHHYHVSYK